ncbi:bifunctional 5-dehydro-2-deoxygluconokinase/5-dehydro-2-deoxyphosphogluconate aldolase [Oryzibacter oryziterrae]|uniref:bifunctional 5-dehydro-2-deoxygluconokinase/5-dehydro-2- deoxyphosphogluconate aldolase n=1 Tax=Oryzibacter oryziterrae TaxID=2766474 RepID=UPI001F00920D|nr:5-dehydro-2-deoxygluconokinase [Oryzibacter oryziterrae]
MTKTLDVVAIGRSSVDLYGQQIGSRLEDITSFAKSVGGCPANISVGTARLGLKSGLITRVGAEQLGGFIREQLTREGVSTQGIAIDKARLTALVILAVQDEGVSPMIFYRTDCADMALAEEDIDEAFIASTRSIVVTGTHFSRPNSDAAQRKAIALAKKHGGKVVFDIDYRPNLWGLAGHDAGFERYVKSDTVSAKLRSVLTDCDLIIGTEEEIMIATGADTVLGSLKAIRALTPATIVLKRGAMGCIVYDGPISDDLEDGIVGQGFPIEVYNVLGAGDAFMSGFLRGWLKGEPLATCATWANACGAFAVSRLLCSPEYPTWDELSWFLEHGSKTRALRKDEDLKHIHWATTRRAQPDSLVALAIDHRIQLEEIADSVGAPREKISDFKVLAVDAAVKIAGGREGFGMLLDSTYGQKALYKAGYQNFWVGRPVEKPGSRPLDFDQLPDLGSHLAEWPIGHTIKCLCFYHPDDSAELKARQERELLRLYDAARTSGRELLIEIIAGKHGPLGDTTVSSIIERVYALGIKPDWWKLEPQDSVTAWANIEKAITANDRYCRGIVLLGLEAPEDQLVTAFRSAATSKLVKGFAVGRTIFADAAARWLKGEMSDAEAIEDMAGRFGRLVEAWQGVKG